MELWKYKLKIYKFRYIITFFLALLTGWAILAFAITDQDCIKVLKKELEKQEGLIEAYESNPDPFFDTELKMRKEKVEALKLAIEKVEK